MPLPVLVPLALGGLAAATLAVRRALEAQAQTPEEQALRAARAAHRAAVDALSLERGRAREGLRALEAALASAREQGVRPFVELVDRLERWEQLGADREALVGQARALRVHLSPPPAPALADAAVARWPRTGWLRADEPVRLDGVALFDAVSRPDGEGVTGVPDIEAAAAALARAARSLTTLGEALGAQAAALQALATRAHAQAAYLDGPCFEGPSEEPRARLRRLAALLEELGGALDGVPRRVAA